MIIHVNKLGGKYINIDLNIYIYKGKNKTQNKKHSNKKKYILF